ncbi:hypothetical protein [Pseudomonas sp. UBA2684]|uniref:hypothetical protein n=1 Tax=Pseudomonas sp. UBA2684 TaxID=1947311 RepID=UPI000E7DCA62|nr:hypothetical protein [Pseudomonas sp. UBA2684]HBX55604.1 hypothetical protein [Pseudomonas sp.]|tara:strand:+ start:11182 stop:11523 length:342 start_codon:yes stop_codon:yes gene_type:complete
MRIDGSIPSYSPDRGPRSGTAVTPFREAQREVEERREQPATPASSQGFEQTPQARRVQASSASTDSLPARPQDLAYPQTLNNRAAQAIASYSSTASFATESDAQQVLGLDLFA